MRKNKLRINALKKDWKLNIKDFENLTWREQLRFCWWFIRGSPRGLFFLMQQKEFGKNARSSYDAAIGNKDAIVLTLTNAGYYHYPSC